MQRTSLQPTRLTSRLCLLLAPAMLGMMLSMMLGMMLSAPAAQAQWATQTWTPTQKLVTEDGWIGDQFGSSSALWHDTAIVGAWEGQSNDEGYASIYRFDGTAWNRSALLIPTGVIFNANFGQSVAVYENWALVGSMRDDEESNITGYGHLYRFDGSTWREEVRLRPATTSRQDWHGFAVALYGDVAAVSAYKDDTAANDAGAVYLYRRTTDARGGETWTEEAKIASPDLFPTGDWFGYSVALHEDVLVVGAILDDPITGASGSAYVYRHDGSAWQLEAKLIPSQGSQGALFGYSVDVWGDLVVVGAESEAINESGTGAAYVFRFDGSQWTEEARLTAEEDEIALTTSLGTSVSAWSDGVSERIVVGCDACSEIVEAGGASWVFRNDGAGTDAADWVREAILRAGDTGEWDAFGRSVALWDDHLVVGAWGDDNEVGESAGAAYVFESDAPAVATLTAEVTTGAVLPPEGGTVTYEAVLTNVTAEAQPLEAWTVIAGPEGTYRSRLGSVTAQPGGRTYTLRQRVPGWPAAGTYEQAFYVGTYPDGIEASARVRFEKSAAAPSAAQASAAQAVSGASLAAAEADPWPAAQLVLATAEAPVEVPSAAELAVTSYPNPVTGAATLRYGLPEAASVRLVVYDVLGREVAVLVDASQAAGEHTVRLEADHLPAGVYFARLQDGRRTVTRTLVKQ